MENASRLVVRICFSLLWFCCCAVNFFSQTQTQPQLGLHYYAIEDLQTGRIILRGTSGIHGIVHPPNSLMLRPNAPYRQWLLHAATLLVGYVDFTTPIAGSSFTLPETILGSSISTDRDQDGLHDQGERILGTDPNRADSDGDGLSDGVEVASGANPLDGTAVATGIVAMAFAGSGDYRDVAAADDQIFAAMSEGGVAIFNVFNSMEPRLLHRIQTPGSTVRLAYSPGFLFTAMQDDGLALYSLSSTPPQLISHLQIGNTVAVQAYADRAIAGTATGRLV